MISRQDAVRTIAFLLEAHSTTGSYARDKQGEDVDPDSPTACSWCLQGAGDLVRGKAGPISPPLSSIDLTTIAAGFAYGGFTSVWDNEVYGTRAQVIARLKNYTECYSPFLSPSVPQ